MTHPLIPSLQSGSASLTGMHKGGEIRQLADGEGYRKQLFRNYQLNYENVLLTGQPCLKREGAKFQEQNKFLSSQERDLG